MSNRVLQIQGLIIGRQMDQLRQVKHLGSYHLGTSDDDFIMQSQQNFISAQLLEDNFTTSPSSVDACSLFALARVKEIHALVSRHNIYPPILIIKMFQS